MLVPVKLNKNKILFIQILILIMFGLENTMRNIQQSSRSRLFHFLFLLYFVLVLSSEKLQFGCPTKRIKT